MRRTERGGERFFYHALAALLFTAVCAWFGAAGFSRLLSVSGAPEPAESPDSWAPGRFSGILLRREARFPAGSFPGAREGARLSARETGTESALYFVGCDGWEQLSPADAERLAPDMLDALLAAPPAAGDENAPRLVYGFALCCAALFEGETPPAPGPCRVSFADVEGVWSAVLVSVTTDASGRTALLLRLTDFPEALYRLRFVEGELAG